MDGAVESRHGATTQTLTMTMITRNRFQVWWSPLNFLKLTPTIYFLHELDDRFQENGSEKCGRRIRKSHKRAIPGMMLDDYGDVNLALLPKLPNDHDVSSRRIMKWRRSVGNRLHTSTLSAGSGTRSWPERPSSWGSWRGRRARPTRGTFACGTSSPIHRSASGWRKCAASSASGACGSGTGARSCGAAAAGVQAPGAGPLWEERGLVSQGDGDEIRDS